MPFGADVLFFQNQIHLFIGHSPFFHHVPAMTMAGTSSVTPLRPSVRPSVPTNRHLLATLNFRKFSFPKLPPSPLTQPDLLSCVPFFRILIPNLKLLREKVRQSVRPSVRTSYQRHPLSKSNSFDRNFMKVGHIV